jgi:lipoprotein-anchoring transpeptidase ErfK/SrfK
MIRPLTMLFVAASLLAACSDGKPKAKTEPKDAPPKPSAAPPASAEPTASAEPPDAAAEPPPPTPEPPPAYDGPYLSALFLQTPIMNEMDWPKGDGDHERRGPDKGSKGAKGAKRIGYIRQGQKVPVRPEPHQKHNCKEGWYELLQGGYVCGRYGTLDPNHPKVRLAPHAPDMIGPLPYQYGYNVANGTPLYRTLPSREERLKLEPWLSSQPKKSSASGKSGSDDALDAGAPLTLTKASSESLGRDDDLDGGTPWYLRSYDGGKPTVTLDELKGEGPIARRMVKGFFVAIDKDMNEKGSRWWKTTGNLLAPFDRIMLHTTASKFRGAWLDESRDEAKSAAAVAASVDAGAPASTAARRPVADLCKPGSKAQAAIVIAYKAKRYVMSTSRQAAMGRDPIARHAVVRLTGDSVSFNGATYEETDEGFWIRASDVVKTNPGALPKDLADGEKWIDVNLRTQTLVAFEGENPVYVTAVSTGKEDRVNKEKDHRTPTGTFRIREKHIAATMDGDVATDGPYSIEDVPWIMYFNGSFALHGAFWHDNFGRTQSHGCVNLAPQDAKALFGWTEPKLPEGWHGVWATPEKQGTRVVVHE